METYPSRHHSGDSDGEHEYVLVHAEAQNSAPPSPTRPHSGLASPKSDGDLDGDLAADLLLRQPLGGPAEDAASEAGAEDGPEQQQEQQQKRVTLVASVVLSAWASSIKLFSTDLATEIREGVDDLRFLLKEAMEATQVCVRGAKGALEPTAHRMQQLRTRLIKAAQAQSPSSWAIISLGAVTAFALVALCALSLDNHRLAMQVKARDKELARLVLRILNLQEALQGHTAMVPMLRQMVVTHTISQPFNVSMV